MKLKLNHQNIYFMSDAHFCHANVIKHDTRPFDDINDMNEQIVKNWNNKVSKNDTVFYLGDFSFNTGQKTQDIADSLNGEIHFILGNHDHYKDIKKLDRFASISDYINLDILDPDGNRGYQGIIMSHYAILGWDKSHHGNWHLHGHEHGHYMQNPMFDWYYKRKVIDVGCNLIDYTPISYSEVKEIMKTKTEIFKHH